MNSNSRRDPNESAALDRINRLLEPIDEEDSLGSSHMRQFAHEAALINQNQDDHRHNQSVSSSVDLRDFPHADFYYKLVAKVNGKYFSIFDGKTEYVIGKKLTQKVKSAHQGGYYCYGTLDEAVFADVPYKIGGHYLAPRTVLKCIAWGPFCVYQHGKLSFTNIMPVEDLGLPLGYKNTKESIKQGIRLQEEMRYKSMEQDYNRRLVLKNLFSDQYERNKFENYFGPKAAEKMEKQELQNEQMRSNRKENVKPTEVNPDVAMKIQSGLEQMFADLENKYN